MAYQIGSIFGQKQQLWVQILYYACVNPIWRIQKEMKTGNIAYVINRPINYLVYHFFVSFGETLIRTLYVVISGNLLLVLSVSNMPSLPLLAIPAVLLSVLLALILSYCLNTIIGLLAFLFEDTSAFSFIYDKMVLIFGGALIPLNFLPNLVERIVTLLPFSQLAYTPARLAVDWTWIEFPYIIAGQLLWLVILMSIIRVQYAFCVNRLSINGG